MSGVQVIPPGACLGILGGGQLGRMTAMAARSMGYRVCALDPDPDCAAKPVVDRLMTAPFDDAAAAAELARGCDVVTLEIEKISLQSLEAAAAIGPVRPGRSVLEIIQDKGRQKSWLKARGFPVGPFELATSADDLKRVCTALGPKTFVKRPTGGYDGKGQLPLERPTDAPRAWTELGGGPLLVESAVSLEAELSVMVARNARGERAVYPPSLNFHEAQILDVSLLPAPIPDSLWRDAEALAHAIAEALRIEGVLAIELFWTKEGSLLVNELAPRPHNTFHSTEVACVTSQFEQLVRAVTGLPLGAVDAARPVAVANLLGDLWLGEGGPRFAEALAVPGTRLHLYGKKEARPGRKMGHLSAVAPTGDEALERVRTARARLGGR